MDWTLAQEIFREWEASPGFVLMSPTNSSSMANCWCQVGTDGWTFGVPETYEAKMVVKEMESPEHKAW